MAVVQGDGSVSLEGCARADRTAVLDRVAVELTELRVRCLHLRCPAPPGRIGLPELTTQVANQFAPGAPPRESLELAFEALTEPGQTCARVALLVADADTLTPPAIRYIELACQRCPQLRVVLAGPPGFLDGLDGSGVSGLRQRVTRELHLAGAPSPPPPPPAADSGPTLVELARANRDNGRSLIGAGIAASLLLASWTTNWGAALTAGSDAVRSAGSAVFAPAQPVTLAASGGNEAAGRPSQAVSQAVGQAGRPYAEAAAPAEAPPIDVVGLPVASLTEHDLPLPPIPPGPLVAPAPAPARAARAAPPTQRSTRGGPERLVSMSTPQADWTRCREIVLMAQMGERLTSAEQRFLRDGCRTR